MNRLLTTTACLLLLPHLHGETPEQPVPSLDAPVSVSITDRELTDKGRWREVFSLVEQAVEAGTPAVIFEIDTSTASPQKALPLAEAVAGLEVPTLAYVQPSAVAGGALLALGCDQIWMAPGSRIGAAAPDLAGSGELSEAAEKQLLSQSLAILKAGARGLSQRNGHRAKIAEAFIDADREVKVGDEVLASGKEVLLLDARQAVAPHPDGEPLLARGTASSLTELAQLALELEAPEPLREDLFASAEDEAAKTSKPKATVSGEFSGKVVRIPVGEEDLVTPARFEFMTRTLERCTQEGAEAVIFDLDTPGGLAWDTTNLMMRDLQKLEVPSFAFVNPRALSAGAMIAVATDGIYFAPAGSAGAATPVYGGGAAMGDAERAKMNSAIMGMARTVAKQKGHDPRVIEAMIDMDQELIVDGQVLSAKGEILTLDAEEATLMVDGRPLFAKGIATSLDEVKEAEGLTGETVTAEPSGFEHIAILVTRYAAMLILIGIAGAYLEMQAPGFGLPGFIALGAFGIFFFGHYVAGSLVGHEATAALVIFFIGVLFLIVEFFLLPGTLFFGILGFLCLMGSLVYTMANWDFSVPEILPSGEEMDSESWFNWNLAALGTALRNFALGLAGAIVVLLLLGRYLPETAPFKAITLDAAVGDSEEPAPEGSMGSFDVPIGATGTAQSALRPYGTVVIGDRTFEATADTGYLDSGTSIRVQTIKAGRIIVEAIS